MDWFKRHYLSIDPRTLGLARILIGLLLLADLSLRLASVELWYSNTGLLPNHTSMWQPSRFRSFSVFWMCSHWEEAAALMLLIALAYLGLLVGYRTRLCQILSLLGVVSLQSRTDMLSSGGDFVLAILLWWTAFLPLGRRLSLDAVLSDLRRHQDYDDDDLARARQRACNVSPVVSLAVLAALMQLALIYFFNAVSKDGSTWKDGTAAHYFLQRELIITSFGLWLRQHASLELSYLLTYGTLLIEGLLPLLILSPVGRPWTHRTAIILICVLHVAIALMSNIGIFSYVMIVFSALLVTREDWETLRRWGSRARRVLVLYNGDSGLCLEIARWLSRLDLLGRLELRNAARLAELPPGVDRTLVDRTLVAVSSEPNSTPTTGIQAVALIVACLPGGYPCGLLLLTPGLRHLGDAACSALARRRIRWSTLLGLPPGGAEGRPTDDHESPEVAPAPLVLRLRGYGRTASEGLVVFLVAVSSMQLCLETRVIPDFLKPDPMPGWTKAVVGYTRLHQGWQMFSPDPPQTELLIVVDAVTTTGRHVDPLAEMGGYRSAPEAPEIPVRPGLDSLWTAYHARLPENWPHFRPLKEWIERYHERTGVAEDRIVSWRAHLLEHDLPRPGEKERRRRRHQILDGSADL